MSTLTASRSQGSGRDLPRLDLLHRPGFAVACGCLLAFLLTLPKTMQVWSTGIFLNPDDAMRAVQVRDFMAGQGWFDLVPHRLSPDHPFTMHWSRLLDLPLAAMVRLFGLVLPTRAAAELAMRLVEPSLLFALSLATMVGLVRRLMGTAAMLPAALLLAGSLEFVGNFIPGHIHHHGVQATLLLGAVKLLIDGLDGRPMRALASGAFAALSLGIGLQNLPFVVGLGAVAGLAWVRAGQGQARLLRAFGLGLSVAAAAVFLLDVPPGRYTEGACDAFSAAHLIAACTIGAVFLALPWIARRATTPIARPLAAAGGAFLVLGSVAFTFPACLHDPMNGVDPILRSRWLADVGEALPLAALMARAPFEGVALLLTLLFGLGATGLAFFRTGRLPGWLALLVLCAIGFAGAIWQIRVAATAQALMVPGLTWAVLTCFARLSRNPKRPALLLATLLGMVGNGAGLTAMASTLEQHAASAPSPDGRPSYGDPARCFEPAALADLGRLPPGLVLSTIDPGSAILAFTPHSVLAAPYHRNSYGNRVALLAFDRAPAEALPLVRDAHPRYLAICRASNETGEPARLHPDSLGAQLLDGHPPSWLVPVGPPDGLYRIYEVSLPSPAG